MTGPEPDLSLDDMIALYLEKVDQGESVDPVQFAQQWPEHSAAFLLFANHLGALEGLLQHQTEAYDSSRSDKRVPDASESEFPQGYRRGCLLGKGGMGSVFAATRDSDGEVVALKVLNRVAITDSDCVHRFQREARIVASLDHPHIVPLYAIEPPATSPTLVMKLIDGVTFSDVIAEYLRSEGDRNAESLAAVSGRRVATSLSQTPIETCLARSGSNDDHYTMICRMMADIANAIQAAHQAGVVHRDIKPSNLMLDIHGKVWLTDFGLASLEDDLTLTGTGDLLGTPAYMSPEQARGETKRIDHRTDIYSLGATLYELATLQKPFAGSRQQIVADVAAGNLRLPSRIRRDFPTSLEAIILHAMSVRPGGRYQSAAALADDLSRVADGRVVMARKPGVYDRMMRWSWRHPRAAFGSAVAVLATFVSIVVIQWMVAGRLTEINQEMNAANQELAQKNQDLTVSQQAIRHHIYVSDLSAAYRAFALGDVDITRQLLKRQVATSIVNEEDAPFEWQLLNALVEPVELQKVSAHDAPVREIAAIGGTSQLLSVCADGVISRQDWQSQRELSTWTVDGRLDAVAVSPDGNTFVIGQNVEEGLNPVTLRDIQTGNVIREFTGHEYSVESIAFSPDGRMVATTGRYNDVLLHSIDGTLLHRVASGSRNESVAFTADSQYLLISVRQMDPQSVEQKNQTIHGWRLADMQQTFELKSNFMIYTFAVTQNSASGSARVFVASGDEVALFEVPDGKMLGSQGAIRGRIRCVAISDLGHRAAAGCDNGLLYLWNLEDQLTGSVERPENSSRATVIDTGRGGITSVVFSSREKLLVSRTDGRVQLIQLAAPNPAILNHRVQSIVQSQRDPNRVFARFMNGTIVRFDQLVSVDLREPADVRERSEPTFLLDVPVDAMARIALSPDERLLAVSAPGELIIASADSGDVLSRIPLPGDDRQIRDLHFSDDRSRLLVLLSDRVLIYRLADWQLLDAIILPNDSAQHLQGSPLDGSILIVTQPELLQFDPQLNTILRRRPSSHTSLASAAFSPSGKLLVAGFGDGTLEVMNAETWDLQATLRGHRVMPWSIVFTQQEQTLLTADADGVTRFWDLNSFRELGVLCGELYEVIAVEPHHAIVTFGQGKPLKVFSASPHQSPFRDDSLP